MFLVVACHKHNIFETTHQVSWSNQYLRTKTKFAKRQNLKLNNFPSTKVIGLKFLPDLTHYEVC